MVLLGTADDEIKDTCRLGDTCDDIMAYINQHPTTIENGAVFIFIPRDFSCNLKPQDYELYNDINAYMNLCCRLDKAFKVFTFYIDRTDRLEKNDKVYNQLAKINEDISTKEPRLAPYFPDLSIDSDTTESYKSIIKSRISSLNPYTQAFFEQVLKTMPDIDDETYLKKQNGINAFISACKEELSNVEHMYASIVRDDVAEDIEDMLRVVHYIKSLTDDKISSENIPDYKTFSTPDYDGIKRLLATYRRRLEKWRGEGNPISSIGTFRRYSFFNNASTSAGFSNQVDNLTFEKLKEINFENCRSMSVVQGVFDKLDSIVADAKETLEIFAYNQSKELYNPNNYNESEEEEFILSDPAVEDEIAEKKQLEAMNKYSHHSLPGYSKENELEQELEIINSQVEQIFERLKAYRLKSFFITLGVCLASVAGFYLWSQYSIFSKEHSWPIFAVYMAVVLLLFTSSYFIVKRIYIRQINALLLESKLKVAEYLKDFKELALEFEKNLLESRKYYCLKKSLDEKAAARRKYQEDMSRYAWHQSKVDETLTNLTFFEYFIGDAVPYDENPVTIKSYDHDAEHTEFYHLTVF